MKEIDQLTIEEWGISDLVLMENAGIRILEEAERLTPIDAGGTVVCAAGAGNNGGDALVVARQIFSRRKNPVSVVITAKSGSEAFNINLRICRRLGIKIFEYGDRAADSVIDSADIIFDGIAGTGIRGPLRDPLPGLSDLINNSSGFVVSIDVPSGIGEEFRKGYPAVKADCTLTVGLPKRGLFLPYARPFCGRIETVPIGFPEELKSKISLESDKIDCRLVSDYYLEELMPVPETDSYKNKRGHLAVFAGSPGTSGAASLCSEAALRTAAGLVSLFADDDVYPQLAARHLSVMVRPFSGELPDMSGFSAAAVGPGWGVNGRTGLLIDILKEGSGVLDADGLNVLAALISDKPEEIPDLGGRWVLTPHPGEFKRLFPGINPAEDPYKAITRAAKLLNCVILLKGHVSFIADGSGRCAVLDGNYPRLGTAGSGDVLTGIIGGYAASGLGPYEAAVLGAAVHLRAAKRCGDKHQWFSSGQLLDFI
jgi:NAD(P)H-hydrate epimerase